MLNRVFGLGLGHSDARRSKFFLKREHMFTIIEPMSLTKRQKEIFEFIKQQIQEQGIPPSVREICKHFGLKGPAGVHRILKVLESQGYLISSPGKNRTWRLSDTTPSRRGIPVLGSIAAGIPIEAQQEQAEELPVDCTLFGPEGCFGLYVKGDSMVGLHIMDGDIAIIRPCKDVEHGEVAAVMVEDVLPEATLKVVKKNRDGIELHAANPGYEPLVFTGRDAAKVSIIGSLAGIIRRRY